MSLSVLLFCAFVRCSYIRFVRHLLTFVWVADVDSLLFARFLIVLVLTVGVVLVAYTHSELARGV